MIEQTPSPCASRDERTDGVVARDGRRRTTSVPSKHGQPKLRPFAPAGMTSTSSRVAERPTSPMSIVPVGGRSRSATGYEARRPRSRVGRRVRPTNGLSAGTRYGVPPRGSIRRMFPSSSSRRWAKAPGAVDARRSRRRRRWRTGSRRARTGACRRCGSPTASRSPARCARSTTSARSRFAASPASRRSRCRRTARARVVEDVEEPARGEVGREREREEPGLADRLTRSRMSRNGRSSSLPVSTIRIAPVCSTTNTRLGRRAAP